MVDSTGLRVEIRLVVDMDPDDLGATWPDAWVKSVVDGLVGDVRTAGHRFGDVETCALVALTWPVPTPAPTPDGERV
jgi:hypothetical protein